ncbi:microfibril-associated glycoprotein 4-like isoform X2 [Onychostoma macrolepis]|uniref:microfibril-associated glycoprotein 4-like isoform X2 n=1 Tax=Onychostoma macrolepis TaxID=369639 RepID=UPI00272AE8EF|nr:microfibril-associated glycoprotein 4-like isoform X2 [Onychostoma macrolepis]
MAMMVFLVILLVVFLMSGCSQNMISDGNDEDKGGWTVIQRRMDGSVNFYQAWHQYKRGFGNMESEYWLGLDNMYQLTRNRNYKLRVDLEDFQGNKVFAQYSSFSVGPEADGYILHVSGFTDGGAGDSLSVHNGFMFSTFDKDQDISPHNCAKKYLGAFWYMSCHHTNPNGWYLWGEDPTYYAIGNVWSSWKGYNVGMKSISMKIKRVS